MGHSHAKKGTALTIFRISTFIFIFIGIGYCVEHLEPHGIEFIKHVQTYGNKTTEAVMHILSSMGFEFYFLAMPFVLWLSPSASKTGRNVLMLQLTLYYAMTYLKLVYQRRRPLWVASEVSSKQDLSATQVFEFSFPSGHSMGIYCTWAYLAMKFDRLWLSILATFIVCGTCFSRIYLGVHYPHDVLAGLVLGDIVLQIGLLLPLHRLMDFFKQPFSTRMSTFIGLLPFLLLLWALPSFFFEQELLVHHVGFDLGASGFICFFLVSALFGTEWKRPKHESSTKWFIRTFAIGGVELAFLLFCHFFVIKFTTKSSLSRSFFASLVNFYAFATPHISSLVGRSFGSHAHTKTE